VQEEAAGVAPLYVWPVCTTVAVSHCVTVISLSVVTFAGAWLH